MPPFGSKPWKWTSGLTKCCLHRAGMKVMKSDLRCLKETLIKSFDRRRMTCQVLIPFMVSWSNMNGINLF